MNKIDREKQTVKAMIEIYCRKKHNSSGELCNKCKELCDYAMNRLDNCRFGENKVNCGDCKIHCYKKDMKEEIIKVMRFSGPRMIFYHPVMALRHLFSKIENKILRTNR